MSNSWFAFKQFTLWHDKCAMKVGTDGVLLGAWTNVFGEENVLDIGAGTGLLALMLAQRTNGEIDAVEIDETAAAQASENCLKSRWNKRINVYNLSIQEFSKTTQKTYDLIVSNPPYFSSFHRSPDMQRAMARHADTLSINDIIKVSDILLKERGRLALILPYESRMEFIKEISKNNFWINRETTIKSDPKKSPFRVLFEVSKNSGIEKETKEIIIRESFKGEYTETFKKLTQDYYLAF